MRLLEKMKSCGMVVRTQAERCFLKRINGMKMNTEDVRIDHLYLGPGKGGRLVVRHVPTGLSVAEDIPMAKSARSIQRRLLAELERMVGEREEAAMLV